MANYSHSGFVASWGSVTFDEVYSCSWSFGGDRQGRPTNWIPNPGSMTLSCYSDSGVTTADCGTRESISVSGGGSSYAGFAILNNISVEFELNGVVRYTLAFTLCDVNP